MKKIILDIMGADNPPEVFIQGAVDASKMCDDEIILVGDEYAIQSSNAFTFADKSRFTIIHTSEYMTMEDNPVDVVRAKRNSSMALALKALADGKGDAVVSAGNTGALFSGSTVIVKPIEGVRRAAIAAVLPLKKPLLLLDSGANTIAGPELLEQFAYMGSAYYAKLFGVEAPTVGLLNNGAEEHKGTPGVQEAYKLLSKADLNFIGNIEGKDVPHAKCDVVVTDGFTGNIVLKFTEGMGSFMMSTLKEMFMSSPSGMMAAGLVKKQVGELKTRFSASEYGGAPLLGISKPVIKAHGNSDAKAIKNAILKASTYASEGVIELIAEKIPKQI